jgi:sugar phosphate isomerase/epimerase
MNAERIVVSACALRDSPLDHVVETYTRLGYQQMECFSRWTASALDERQPADPLRDRIAQVGMSFYSLHLPPVTEDVPTTLREALAALKFASDLGMRLVVFAAKSLPLYLQVLPVVLTAAEPLRLTVTIEIHANTVIASLADALNLFRQVPDPRLKAVLEVGHLHKAGDHWRDACRALGERIAIVHLKDIKEGRNVGFHQGEIDLDGLVAHLRERSYAGAFVIEILVADRENTELYLRQAHEWLLAQPD